jgi:phage recombination protein Bet
MSITELAISPEQAAFTEKQIAVLKTMGAEKASREDLAVFFHYCKTTGLDPFRKQIYMIGRWDSRSGREKYAVQTGIDGFRHVAERTGTFAGVEEEWEERGGKLYSATVTVRRIVAGHICNFSAVAHWEEYAQVTKEGKPSGLWAKLPHRMLAKCAESSALRRAFGQELAGIYTTEEMANADAPVTPIAIAEPQPQPQPEPSPFEIDVTPSVEEEVKTEEKPVTATQIKRIHTIKAKLALDDETYRGRLTKLYAVTSSKDLSQKQAADLIKRLEDAAK